LERFAHSFDLLEVLRQSGIKRVAFRVLATSALLPTLTSSSIFAHVSGLAGG
jgi:hypothetical protein